MHPLQPRAAQPHHEIPEYYQSTGKTYAKVLQNRMVMQPPLQATKLLGLARAPILLICAICCMLFQSQLVVSLPA